MAYALSNPLHRMGPPNAGKSFWAYWDGDALGTIDGSGYFDLDAAKLTVEDIIKANGNSVIGFLRVNAISSGVVDCDNAIPLPTAVVDSD